MKLLLLNDSHVGCRNDSPLFNQMIVDYFAEQIFPFMRANGITKIVHLGDVMDRRKFINYTSLEFFQKGFIQPIIENGFQCDILLGNHDVVYKNTNSLNSMDLLLSEHKDNFTVYQNAAEIVLDGRKILYIPWICKDNYDQTIELIKKTDAIYAMGHLELAGFDILAGIKSEEGMGVDIFNKFNRVMSGHYHHKSDNGLIYYLGTQYELTWADYNDPKGFHTFDTETGELEFHQNPNRLFHKIIYNDETTDYKKFNFSQYRNKFVKLIVEKKKSALQFEKFLDRMYAAELADFQIIEDSFLDEANNLLDTEENYEDTLTLMESYVKNLGTETTIEKELGSLLKNLYLESIAE